MTATPDDIALSTRRLIAAGDLTQADALLTGALGLGDAHGTGAAEWLYLRGVIAQRRQDSPASLRLFEAALTIDPRFILAWLALGHAHIRLGAPAEAAAAYARATELEPTAADAFFNLGLARRQLGDLVGAASAFHAAWVRDPQSADAAKGCVGTIALAVREGRDALPLTLMSPPTVDPRTSVAVSVIVCSIDENKAAQAHHVYERSLVDIPHEIILIRDARSLAEAYNRGVDRARGDVIVLSHDDIDILTPDFAARLLAHLDAYDIVGVVGSTRMTGPLPIWSGHPHLRGWITHHVPGAAEWFVDVLDPRAIAGEVVVLDGVLLAARRAVFDTVRFDEVTFDGFHGYDVDWSFRAAQAGFRLAAAGDLLIVHASRGRHDDVWQRYAERFCVKHSTGNVDPAPPPFYESSFRSPTQVQAFYARLQQLGAVE